MFKLVTIALSTAVNASQFGGNGGLFQDRDESVTGQMQKGWLDAFTEMRGDVFSQAGMRKYLSDVGEAYEMLMQTDNYKRK